MRNKYTALQKTYTRKIKTQIAKDTEWINKQKWSTPNEQQTMEYVITERRNLQVRIEQLRTRTTAQTDKIILTKSLYAWKQYTTTKTTKNATK